MRKFLYKQLFKPTFLGFFVNPFFWGRAAIYNNVKKHAPEISGKTLDVGTGSKPYINLFPNVTEYIGMDIEQSGHTHQKEYIDVFYDGKHFPFDANTFDSLVFFEVLEHVFTPDAFISEIKRVVKPGGKCLVTIPFIWGEHEQPYDFARYSSFGLNHLFKEHGFKVIKHHKYLTDFRLFSLLVNNYFYIILKKALPSPIAWLILLPIGFINNLLGLVLWLLPKNEDMYFGNVYVLENIK